MSLVGITHTQRAQRTHWNAWRCNYRLSNFIKAKTISSVWNSHASPTKKLSINSFGILLPYEKLKCLVLYFPTKWYICFYYIDKLKNLLVKKTQKHLTKNTSNQTKDTKASNLTLIPKKYSPIMLEPICSRSLWLNAEVIDVCNRPLLILSNEICQEKSISHDFRYTLN